MKSDRRQRRGVRPAFLALLWLSACSAVGCTKCTSTGIFSHDAGSSTPPTTKDPCATLPDPPDAGPDIPKPCRYWVAKKGANQATCPNIPVPARPGMSWQGSSMFKGEGVPDSLLKYCNYEWSDSASGPTDADLATLPSGSSSNCTYVTKQQATPDVFTKWARDELLPPVAERLAASGAPATLDVKVRVVVLDTAHSGATNSLPSRHGRTLAQLIRESACQNPADCAVEVRSALAMPLVLNTQTKIPERGQDGGYFGLLSDVTSAIWEETNRYRYELERPMQSPEVRRKVPLRVIFNESFGFGNTDALPNRCSDTPPPADDLTATALLEAMTAASCLGILHVAAAGNHTGGDDHFDGMLCPARWDHAIVPTDAVCERIWGTEVWAGNGKTTGLKTTFRDFSLAKSAIRADTGVESALFSSAPGSTGTDALLSVGGVDYHGSPIVLTRPRGCPEAVAIGIGGNSLESSSDIAPFLFGTSVSAAVASSRLAIQWAKNTSPTAKEMQSSSTNSITSFQRGNGLCGRSPIDCGNTPWIGKPATTIDGQNAAWPKEPDNVLWLPVAEKKTTVTMPPAVCLSKLPHCQRPSRAMTADVWPQPVDPVCLKCGIFLPTEYKGDPELWIEPNPSFTPGPGDAILVVESALGNVMLTRAIARSAIVSTSRTVIGGVDRAMFSNARVWLSGYDSEGKSYSQQIFVDK